MRPCGTWQPGFQPGRQPVNLGAVATRLPRQNAVQNGAADAVLISNGNQVATQEGR
jgi:hypothetical protein